MKDIILKAIQSKRFVAFVISIILFVSLIFLTEKPPMDIAGSIGIICGIYIGGDTLRKSDIEK
jgi:hypothetical protein